MTATDRGRRKLIRREVTHSLPGESPLLSRLFAGRGITHPDELDHSLAGLLPPDDLHGMDVAAGIVCDAIVHNRKLLILGDFDADGATSSALLISGFKLFGARHVAYLVPDRFKFGYGLTPEIVDVARHTVFEQMPGEQMPDVLITVDNGISSVDGVAHANSLGMEVIVTDHHLPGRVLPDAVAIVNPNQAACHFPSKCLAGVGVAFYLLLAVRARLREADWFTANPVPNLARLLDLVALGTIADVVPLDRNNRILVNEGIKRMRNGTCCPGVKALLEVSGVDARFVTSMNLSYQVAPRLNAAGRLEDMSIGIECLLADGSRAAALASKLDQINAERKHIESEMRQQAEDHVAALQLDQQNNVGLTLYHEAWHQGVVGIVASRIKERNHRPVVAFAKATSDELKGSGRSIQGFHIRDAFDAIAARNPGLLTKFGGHAMAAGLTLKLADLDKFREEFDREARALLRDDQLEHLVVSDGEITEAISLKLARQVVNAAPWGQGFPEPIFDGVFTIIEQRIVGGQHLKLTLQPANGDSLDAICFNHPSLLDTHNFQCAYRLDVNRFRGRETVQLIIEAIL